MFSYLLLICFQPANCPHFTCSRKKSSWWKRILEESQVGTSNHSQSLDTEISECRIVSQESLLTVVSTGIGGALLSCLFFLICFWTQIAETLNSLNIWIVQVLLDNPVILHYRMRLSYKQFGEFLAIVKDFNAQTRNKEVCNSLSLLPANRNIYICVCMWVCVRVFPLFPGKLLWRTNFFSKFSFHNVFRLNTGDSWKGCRGPWYREPGPLRYIHGTIDS